MFIDKIKNKKDEVIPITNGTPLENERAAFKFFDVIYATKYFCDVFERPNPNYAHMDQRYANARIVLSRN